MDCHRELKDITPLLPTLAKFRRLEDLDISDNKLSWLPDNLSSLGSLKSFNVAGNRFANFAAAVAALKTLPKLRRLHIILEDKPSVQLILDSLPQLEVLNNEPVTATIPEVEAEEYPQTSSLCEKEAEQEPIAGTQFKYEVDTFNSIRSLRTIYEPTIKPKLEQQLQEKLASIQGRFKEDAKASGHEQQALVLKAKHELLDLCFENMLEIQPDKDTAKMWANIRRGHGFVVEQLLSIVQAGRPDLERSLIWHKRELEKLKTELADTLTISQELEDNLRALENEKEGLVNKFEREKAELLRSAKVAESERRAPPTKSESIVPPQKPNVPVLVSKAEAQKKSQKLQEDKDVRTTPVAAAKVNESTSPPRTGSATSKKANKALTLKQLKDILQDIYNHKRQYDRKCQQGQLPRETMEQYMYTRLNQLYGLKVLILDWTNAILSAVTRFASVDTEVAFFGKVLRNVCDEDFRTTLFHVKEGIASTIKESIRSKHKLITEDALTQAYESQVRGRLSYDVWKGVIGRLFNATDAQAIMATVMQHIEKGADQKPRQEKVKIGNNSPDSKVEKSVEHSAFQDIVLAYVLARHEAEIFHLLEEFKKIDFDSNGIISQEECSQLLQFLCLQLNESESQRLHPFILFIIEL